MDDTTGSYEDVDLGFRHRWALNFQPQPLVHDLPGCWDSASTFLDPSWSLSGLDVSTPSGLASNFNIFVPEELPLGPPYEAEVSEPLYVANSGIALLTGDAAPSDPSVEASSPPWLTVSHRRPEAIYPPEVSPCSERPREYAGGPSRYVFPPINYRNVTRTPRKADSPEFSQPMRNRRGSDRATHLLTVRDGLYYPRTPYPATPRAKARAPRVSMRTEAAPLQFPSPTSTAHSPELNAECLDWLSMLLYSKTGGKKRSVPLKECCLCGVNFDDTSVLKAHVIYTHRLKLARKVRAGLEYDWVLAFGYLVLHLEFADHRHLARAECDTFRRFVARGCLKDDATGPGSFPSLQGLFLQIASENEWIEVRCKSCGTCFTTSKARNKHVRETPSCTLVTASTSQSGANFGHNSQIGHSYE